MQPINHHSSHFHRLPSLATGESGWALFTMKPMQSLPVRPTPYTPPLAHPIGRGFTAIELLIVIAVIAVLAALAGPSFTPIIERWRVRQAAEDLQASLYYARSEAIKRGGNVTITKSPNSSNCANASSNTQWGCGWTVDAGGTSLQQVAAPNRVAITLAGSSGSISVDRWGMLSHGSAVGTTVAMDFLLAPLGMDANNKSSLRLCTGVGGRIVQIKGSESCS